MRSLITAVTMFFLLILILCVDADAMDMKTVGKKNGIMENGIAKNSSAEVMDGCQGEGCSCFQGYRIMMNERKSTDFDIETIRPFSLYKDMDKNSKFIGKFEPGVKARPIAKKMLFLETGEYIIEQNKDKKINLQKGDKVHKLFSLGEGYMKVEKDGKWIEFAGHQIKLKPIKKTIIEEWLEVSINGLKGFTQDSPFEMCLE